MKDKKQKLKDLFEQIFASAVFDESIVKTFFVPEYQQEVDGSVLDYNQFCRHLKIQKESISSMDFDFETIISEGNIVFSNHIATMTTKKGATCKIRVIAEFHFKNNKVAYCNELTHMISGSEEDRDLGSRH